MSDSLQYLLESGVCLAIFYLIYWVFLKKETYFEFNRFFLMLSIPLSFAIPLFNITSPFRTSPIFERTFVAGPTAGKQGQLLSYSDILWFAFLLGAGYFFLRFVLRLTQILFLVRKYGYHIYDGVKVIVTDIDTAPFSFFSFLFISKFDITDHGFERILAHEMTHIKQYHSIDLLFLELLTIFQWFNPFVWPYKKALKETHEYLADHAVIAQGCSRAKYQLLIFEQHVGLNMFEFTNNFSQSLIKRRITMMAKIKSNGRAKLKALMILPVIALLVLAFAESKPVPTQPVDGAVISQSDTHSQSQSQDKKAEEVAKKKELEKKMKAKEILEKEAKLKEMYETTEDPEEKKKIKAKLVKIQEWKENNGYVKVKTKDGEESYKEAVKELKALYEKTDDPEKKNKIKKKLAHLEKIYAEKEAKKKSEHVEDGELAELKAKYKNIEMKQKELKAAYEKTDNPEKKKKIKEKYTALEKEKELIKKKAEKSKEK